MKLALALLLAGLLDWFGRSGTSAWVISQPVFEDRELPRCEYVAVDKPRVEGSQYVFQCCREVCYQPGEYAGEKIFKAETFTPPVEKRTRIERSTLKWMKLTP